MADIRLRVNEADGNLPDVCLYCGEPAETTKTRKMSWCPPWVGILILTGVLPYVIVAMVMTRRATVQAPLCDQHQGHWLNRALLMWGSFFLFGLMGAAGLIFGLALPQRDQDTVMPFVCAGAGLLFVVWLVIVVACQNTAIRPKEITESEITLTGVSDVFVDAVEADRDERRARKRQRARIAEEDDEDEVEEKPRRRRPPPLDAIEE